jgi:hypothetical protein
MINRQSLAAKGVFMYEKMAVLSSKLRFYRSIFLLFESK